ncbi:MAG: hypothetical protein NXI00_23060 [Cytophagales bacterium]|nr:hypothetical protein [Cytophagales bacterium]
MLQQEFDASGLPSLRPYLNYLIDRGQAEHVQVKWGTGYRWVIKIGGKTYPYKGGHEINNSLKKKNVSYIQVWIIKVPIVNQNKSDNLNVDLDFDDDPNEDRTWVNKDRFGEFESEYQDLQDNSAVSTAVQIEFEMRITVRNVDKQKTETKNQWQPLTTVYGGTHGVKLFIKHYIVGMVYGYEDSMYEILSISLNKLYIQKKKQELQVKFREIKMYGTIFNYTGFGLQALNGKTPDACVPEYVFDLYHNPDETNPRKMLAKLTMEQVLKELNMNAIDEGCSIEQIAGFCDIHKITYYVLDFKYKLFETNNHKGYKSNLPCLVFVCANNHLYPIDDHERRETIFKSCSTIGGKMNKYRTQQKFENVKLGYNEALKNYVLLPDMSFYGLLAKVQREKDYDTNYNHYRIIVTTPGACNAIFYEEIRRGNIHNGKVRLSKGSQIVGFEMFGITIDENEHYTDIQMTLGTLNGEIDKESEKYNYTGRAITT